MIIVFASLLIKMGDMRLNPLSRLLIWSPFWTTKYFSHSIRMTFMMILRPGGVHTFIFTWIRQVFCHVVLTKCSDFCVGREPLITQIYFKDQVVTPGGYVDSHAKKVEDLHLDLQEKTVRENFQRFIFLTFQLKRPSGDFAYKYARFDIVLKRKAA